MPSYCLNCRIPQDLSESAYGIMLVNGMEGSEELEAAGLLVIKGYFLSQQSCDSAAGSLESLSAGSVTGSSLVEDQDWNARWRETMEPVKVADGIWVSPAWLVPPLEPKDRWIKIEPKMAFGTGHHATTRLAAQAVIAQARATEPRIMLDIGTGSGVLCFAAGLCGVSRCVGVEIDPQCRENLAENRLANNFGNRNDFAIGGLACVRDSVRIDLAVMNMIYPQSAPLLRNIRERLHAPRGTLVWSGILVEGRQEAADAAAAAGFSLVNESAEDEWWCGTFS